MKPPPPCTPPVPDAFFDLIVLGSDDDTDRLRRYAKGGYAADPQPGFWTDAELGRRG